MPAARRKRRSRPKTKAGRRRAETRRLNKLLALERSYWERGVEHIAGVDEAGRGPLAGPVVAAAVVMPPDRAIRGVDDSKRLDAERREFLYGEILDAAIAIGVGAASTREVDRLNILRATHVAMRRAVDRLRTPRGHVPTPDPGRVPLVIVDGLPVPLLGEDHVSVVDGDAQVHCIACASIIAKVTRDRLMRRLALRYPGYGWEQNVGYGTPEHVGAIAQLGLTPHHRRSFEPNLQYTLDLGGGP